MSNLIFDVRYARRDELYGIAEFLHDAWQAEYRQIVSDDYLDTMSIEERHKGLLLRYDEKAWEYLIMTADGRTIGVAVLGKAFTEGYESDGEIPAIYLNTDYIGKGYGHRLFTAAEQALTAKEYSHIILDVFAGNTRAICFYSAHGYKKVDDRRVKLGEKEYPLVVMRKEIER